MLCSFSFSFFLLTFTGEAGEFFLRGIMAATTPKAIDDCHELLLWIIPQLDKFPLSSIYALRTQTQGDFRRPIPRPRGASRIDERY